MIFIKGQIDESVTNYISVGDIKLVTAIYEDADSSSIRKVIAYVEKKLSSGIVLLGSRAGGKATLQCAVTSDLVDNGYNARTIIDGIVGNIGGGGGGNAGFAQAGGKNIGGLEKSLDDAQIVIGSMGK